MDQVLPEPSAASATTPAMSLSARLFNVYATPGDVFESLKGVEPRAANWLVPVLLSCLVGIVYVLVVFAQPNVQQQLREKQDQQLQKLVDSGKLSAADMESQRARMDQMGMTIIKVAGAASAVVASFAFVFALAIGLKLVARLALGRSVEYMKLVEVVGLAGMITVLGTLVQMLLVILMGSIYVTAGPALFLSEFDAQNKVHLLLASINLMTIWYLGVLAIGVARLAESPFFKAALPLFVLWVVLRVSIVFLGWGTSGM